MHFPRFAGYVAAVYALLSNTAVAAPSLGSSAGLGSRDILPGEYIVKVKPTESRENIIGELLSVLLPTDSILYSDWDKGVFDGFAGKFGLAALAFLQADPRVEYLERNAVFTTQALETQNDAPWGLQRISDRAKIVNGDATNLNYRYKRDGAGGQNVDIYVVDTGINTGHVEFNGRATWGATFGGYGNADGNGHGTHCAGTAGGARYGVAKKANLIAVKVLSDAGSGSTTDIIAGIDWVVTQARTGRSSIISMSLGGSTSTALDSAVTSATNNGVHVVVAAGNSYLPASTSSPARAPAAITVGASDINDNLASFSNYGSVVDIIAPGVDITSAWMGSTTATNRISGTSMATPHVAGLLAYMISIEGNRSPAEQSDAIKAAATKNALNLGLIPAVLATPNLLAYNKIV